MTKITKIISYGFSYWSIRGSIHNTWNGRLSNGWSELGLYKDGIFRMYLRQFQIDKYYFDKYI